MCEERWEEEWDISFISDQTGTQEDFKFCFDETDGRITGEVRPAAGPNPIPLKGSRALGIGKDFSVMHFIFELRGNSVFLAGCQISIRFEGRYGAFAPPAVDARVFDPLEPGETGTGGGSQQTRLRRGEEAGAETSRSSYESAPKGE